MLISNFQKHFSILGFIYLFFASAGKVVFEFDGFLRLYLILATLIFFIPLMKRFKIDLKILLIFLLIISSILVSYLLNRTPLNWTIWAIANISIPLLVLFFIHRSNFPEIFVKSTSLIAQISLFFWIIHILFKPDYSFFPRITNDHVNLWIVVLVDNYSLIQSLRNQSFFWEPGAYHVVLSIALYLETFHIENPSTKRTMIFILSLLSTFSAAAIISIFFFLIIKSNKIIQINIKQVFILLIAFILFFNFYELYESLIIKLFNFFSGNIENNESIKVRYNSFFLPIKLIIEHPILGAGVSSSQILSQENSNMLTNTFMNIAAIFGIPILTIHLTGLLQLTKKIEIFKMKSFILFIWLITIFSSQNFFLNPIYLILIFYGLSFVGVKNYAKK